MNYNQQPTYEQDQDILEKFGRNINDQVKKDHCSCKIPQNKEIKKDN